MDSVRAEYRRSVAPEMPEMVISEALLGGSIL